MRKNIWLVAPVGFLLSFWLSSCFVYTEGEKGPNIVDGYRPIYGEQEQKEIKIASARAVKNPGKIYLYKTFLLVNEANEGIHVFDNVDPEHPKAVGFLQILGNSDMAVKDDVLYADHMGNLVALTVDNFNSVSKVGTLPLQNWDLGLPPPIGSYFECIDQSKGLVVRWTRVELNNPDCYAIN